MQRTVPSSAPQPGTILGGKYRVVRVLGQGGMGAVFEAVNTFTEKRVALKWLHPDVAASPEATARLMREAQASARVRHPNVVNVYDFGREGELVFLVMEYLDGEPLTEALARGDLPMYRLIALLLPAMRGVAAAHRQGVIHRDIKPDNIFLAREADVPDPVPKVLDFGISKVEPRGAEQLSLTKTGSTMGTPMYMSCEQLTGAKDVDGRTDVYAFGVTLYEALTGRAPFEGETFHELAIKAATTDPTPPKELRPEIPGSLARLILRAMARDRDERVPSMDVLIRELEPFATEQGFRAQMTAVEAAAPRMATPFRAERATPSGLTAKSRESEGGRTSTPVAGTAPSLPSRGAGRLQSVLGAMVLVAVLVVTAVLVLRKSELDQRAGVRVSAPSTVAKPPPLGAQPPESNAPRLVPEASTERPGPTTIEPAKAELPRRPSSATQSEVTEPHMPAKAAEEKRAPRAPKAHPTKPHAPAPSAATDDQFRVGRAPRIDDF